MNIFTFFRRVLLRPSAQPGVLRNRKGGLAFVKRYGAEHGADAIAGQVVRTVQTTDSGFWIVEPKPMYRCTRNVIFPTGVRLVVGQVVVVRELRDDVLDPIPDLGLTQDEVDQLYAPPPKPAALQQRDEVS